MKKTLVKKITAFAKKNAVEWYLEEVGFVLYTDPGEIIDSQLSEVPVEVDDRQALAELLERDATEEEWILYRDVVRDVIEYRAPRKRKGDNSF